MADTAHVVEHTARTLTDHLPVLQVLIPFMAAPTIVFLGSKRLAWGLAFLATAASFVVSIMLMLAVKEGNFVAYTMGGWAPPLGIEYRIDAANAFVLLLISSIGTVVLPFAYPSVKDEIRSRDHTLFYACWMLCYTGLLGMVATGDAFNVFVFLEISSLSTYVLVAQGAARDRRALTAAYDYLIMGTIGATFFVIGLGMLYMADVPIAPVAAKGLHICALCGDGVLVCNSDQSGFVRRYALRLFRLQPRFFIQLKHA